MNGAVVAKAVLARIKVDTTLWSGGAWTSALTGGASFNKSNPTTLAFPFVVFGLEWSQDATFDGIEGRAELNITMFDEDAQGTSRLEYLIDRLIGDSTLSTGTRTAPTYGFHCHALDLGSNTLNANSERWLLTRSVIAPSDTISVNQATLTFSGRVGNTAVNQ
jgi:hypothetical protein